MEPRFFSGKNLVGLGEPFVVLTIEEKEDYYWAYLFCIIAKPNKFEYDVLLSEPYLKDDPENTIPNMVEFERIRADKYFKNEMLCKFYKENDKKIPDIDLGETTQGILGLLCSLNSDKMIQISYESQNLQLKELIKIYLKGVGITDF